MGRIGERPQHLKKVTDLPSDPFHIACALA
jgi:hypothetical protein